MRKALLLAILLLAQLAFPLWTHTAVVEVKDSSGSPLPNIKIMAVFQNRGPSDTDGYAESYTGRDGKAILSLSNQVLPPNDITAYAISASSQFFEEQKKNGTAVSGQDSSAQHTFTISGTFAVYKVTVVDKDGRAVSGAKVVLRKPFQFAQATGDDGVAYFTLPQPSDVEFYVSKSGVETTLGNPDVQRTAEGNFLLARLDASFAPPVPPAPPTPGAGFKLNLQILDQKKVPIKGLEVTYKIPNLKEKNISTDSTGKISIVGIKASPITIAFTYSGYLFTQDIPVTTDITQIVQIPTLLNITNVEITQNDNCFAVRVLVTDPRDEKISVYGLYSGGDKQKPVSFNPTDSRTFSGDFCATGSGKLTVFASNPYDTVSVSKDLIIAGAGPGEIPIERNETAIKEQQERALRDNMILVLTVLFLIIIIGTVFFFRLQLNYFVRGAVQYIRKLFRV
jgi:hypothetical protein